MHRIRSNAKSLILLILLTAGTLAVFGSTVLSMWYPYQSFRRIIPSAIEYRVTNEQEKEISLQALQEACDEQEYEVYETIIFKVKATSDRLPTEYSISEDKGRIPGFEMYQPDRLCHPAFSAGKESGYSRIIRYGLHFNQILSRP